MKLDQLLAFETVAQHGHFTNAADELFITQPSLSRQIAALERDLGATLFERGRQGARLTVEGEALRPIARRMLADAEAARLAMAEYAGLQRGRVRLGAPPTLCVSIVADVLAQYRVAYPGVDLVITEAGSRELVDALAEGALDLALTIARPHVRADAAVESVALFTEELVVATSSAGEGLGRDITLERLAEVPLVMFHRGYDLRLATDAAFASAGLTPTVAVEGAEMDAVLRFVERGVGAAVVPETVMSGRPSLRATRLIRPSLKRTANLSRRTAASHSPAIAEMERAIHRCVSERADLTQWDVTTIRER